MEGCTALFYDWRSFPVDVLTALACVYSFLSALKCQVIGRTAAAAANIEAAAVHGDGGGLVCGGKKK